MKVLHNIYRLGRASFGVGEVVRSLARAQAARQLSVAAVFQGDEQESFHSELAAGVRLYRLRANRWAKAGFHPNYFTDIRLRQFDIVHQHSSWTANSLFSLFASYVGSKVIYAPHGTLAPEALKKSRLKKALVLALYERQLLRRSAAIQALSTQERDDIRRFGVKAPVAVIPNGIDDRTIERAAEPAAFRERFGLPEKRKVLLFLGRINPIKGLDLLLPILGESERFCSSWLLVLAGPTEEPFLNELQQLIEKYRLQDLVRFTGPLYGEDKLDAYDGCDGFVLPSRSEAMPMVVLEAMARRKPVLVTEATPILEIAEQHAGIRTGLTPSERRRGTEAFLALSDVELRLMGERGHQIVSETYRWTHISAMTEELYRWLLDPRRPLPAFMSL